MIVTPAERLSGILVEADGLGSAFATNYYRRRAYLYVERVSYKNSEGVVVESPTLLTSPHVDLSAIKAINNTLVNFMEFAGGARDFYQPTRSDALPVPLYPSDARTTSYRITTMGLGVTPGDYERLTAPQKTEWLDVAFRSLVIDFTVPILTNILLPAVGGDLDSWLSFFGASGALKDIITALAANPDIATKLQAGNIVEAAWDAALVITNSDSLRNGLLQALVDYLDQGFPNLPKLDKAIRPQWFKDSAVTLLKYFGAIDIGLQVFDTLVQAFDLSQSQLAEIRDVIVTKPKVNLSPAASTISRYGVVSLKALVLDDAALSGDVLTYHWSVSGGNGHLVDAAGHSGTDFDSSKEDVAYSHDGGGSGVDTVKVEAGSTIEGNFGGIGTGKPEGSCTNNANHYDTYWAGATVEVIATV